MRLYNGSSSRAAALEKGKRYLRMYVVRALDDPNLTRLVDPEGKLADAGSEPPNKAIRLQDPTPTRPLSPERPDPPASPPPTQEIQVEESDEEEEEEKDE